VPHDLEGVRNDADGHQLLAVVAAVHHQRVGETLDDGAVGLAEALDGIATGGMRNVDGGADLDVVAAQKEPLVSSFLVSSLLVAFAGFGVFGVSRARIDWEGVLLRQGDITDLDILVAPTVCKVEKSR